MKLVQSQALVAAAENLKVCEPVERLNVGVTLLWKLADAGVMVAIVVPSTETAMGSSPYPERWAA